MKNKYLRALAITLIIEALFYVIGKIFGLFQLYCKLGGACPSEEKIFFEYFLYSIIPLYIVVWILGIMFRKLKK